MMNEIKPKRKFQSIVQCPFNQLKCKFSSSCTVIFQPNEPPILVFLNLQHGKSTSSQTLIPPGERCTIPNIMKAILLTAGPISNLTSFRHGGPHSIRDIVTEEQYREAACRLQEANLGQYITVVIGHSRPKEIFIKKTPKEAEEILTRNNELCIVPIEYTKRFNMAVHRKILAGMRRKLVELGYLTEEQYILR